MPGKTIVVRFHQQRCRFWGTGSCLGHSQHPKAGAVVVTAGPRAFSLGWWKGLSHVSLGFAPKPDRRNGKVPWWFQWGLDKAFSCSWYSPAFCSENSEWARSLKVTCLSLFRLMVKEPSFYFSIPPCYYTGNSVVMGSEMQLFLNNRFSWLNITNHINISHDWKLEIYLVFSSENQFIA